MGNEDGSEDRLTKNEFAELIQHLSVQEILTIEYRIGNVWNKLFLRKNVQTHNFFCHLCGLETSSFKNLLAHIDGRKHKLQMERVDQLYQQDYTYPKNYKNETIVNEKKLETVGNNKASSTVAEETVDVQKKNNVSLKSSTEIKNQNKIEECDKVCEKKNGDVKALQENLDSQPKNMEVVEDKQDSKAPNVNPVITNTKSVQKVSEKRHFVERCGDKDIDLKKPKIVVNPAAVLSAKGNFVRANESEVNSKQPEYQTDRIIIPTAHKNKSPALTSQANAQADVAPKFAVKSYSSKPHDNDAYGILGVEYVIKILKNRTDISPRYECGLCELVLDGFAMQRHLEGYNHRLKFCEKHFPTAIRQYRHYMQNVPEAEIFKVMTPVLAKLAKAIEQHHGRNLPYECYERDFNLNRHEILAKAFSCRHASEQYGPTFTHVVGSKEIDEFIHNRNNYLPAPFSRTAIFDTKPDSINNRSQNRHQNFRNFERESNLRERLRQPGRENTYSDESTRRSYTSSCLQNSIYAPFNKSNMHADDRNNVPPMDDETYNLMVDDFLKGTLTGVSRKNSSRKRPSSTVQNSNPEKRKSLSPLRQDDIWQAYRHLVDQELYKLEERFNQYRKEPESHPSYNEEWQKFWKQRKDELVSAGLDHRNYNYQPEWVRFVKIRIEELYEQEIEDIKIKSRERLCLPMSNEQLPNIKYHVKSQQRSLSTELTAAEYNNTQQNAGPVACPKNSPSQHVNTPQVVSVLRLMTALEDSLGSLGPKIIDLLSKALQTEKINPLHVNAIILNDDNCSLIETAKEKLKGLVITGLFEGSKKKVLKQVVTDAESLLNYAYQFKQELSSQRFSSEASSNQMQTSSSFSIDNISLNVSNALKSQHGSSNFFNKIPASSSLTDNLLPRIDKKELASKLAASLVAQGKTEFDPSQLQQIIAVYKLFEKKKRETAGTILSNKSYYQDSASVNRKTLSDTLSDLLKASPSSVNVTSVAGNNSKTSNNATENLSMDMCSSVVPRIFVNNNPSNSFTSVLQNPRDNFFNSTTRSMSNAYDANNVGGNPIDQQTAYAQKYATNLPSNQPNFNTSNTYSNQFQSNSRVAQNWGWNSNMNANQNYNMGNPNNSLNRNSNWQHY